MFPSSEKYGERERGPGMDLDTRACNESGGSEDVARKDGSAGPSDLERIVWVSATEVGGVVRGALPNKSNSRCIVTNPRTGRLMVIKSKEARKYEAAFGKLAALANPALTYCPIEGKLSLTVTVYQENLRRDLDCELLPDLLQKFGIVRNDRHFWRKTYSRRLDAQYPRIEFHVQKIAIEGGR